MESQKFTHDNEVVEPAHKLGRPKKNQKNQPTHFISIPIQNDKIIDNLFTLNCDLLDCNADVEKHILPSSSYHLTLCTLRIANDEERTEVGQILKSVLKSKEVTAMIPIQLKFKDVGEFYNKVFFVKSDSTDEIAKLDYIRKMVLSELEKNQINTAGNYYEFVPHLTVFKIRKEKQVFDKATVMTLLNEKVWQDYKDFDFGTQNINEFQLCRMGLVDHTYPVDFKIRL